MSEQLRDLSESLAITEPTQGFQAAEQNLDKILTKICHNAWEKEVIAKSS